MDLTPKQLAEYELRATMAERERCAVVAEKTLNGEGYEETAKLVADAIRG